MKPEEFLLEYLAKKLVINLGDLDNPEDDVIKLASFKFTRAELQDKLLNHEPYNHSSDSQVKAIITKVLKDSRVTKLTYGNYEYAERLPLNYVNLLEIIEMAIVQTTYLRTLTEEETNGDDLPSYYRHAILKQLYQLKEPLRKIVSENADPSELDFYLKH